LSEIAKTDPKERSKLVPIILRILKKETNSGLKNLYPRALKVTANKFG